MSWPEGYTLAGKQDVYDYERVLFLDLDILVRNVEALDRLFEDIPAGASA